jgi:hypothetical protein
MAPALGYPEGMTKSSTTLAATLRRQATSDLRRWHAEAIAHRQATHGADPTELCALTAELDRRALEAA